MKAELGTLYFDGDCHLCTRGVTRLKAWLAKRGVAIEPFPSGPGIAPPAEMRLHCCDGRELGGADAALAVVGARGLGKLLARVGRLPGIFALLNVAYRWVAARRHCQNGSCQVPAQRKGLHLATAWVLTGGLTVAAFAFGRGLGMEGWVWMWLLALALWLGFKLLALATTARNGWPRGGLGWLGYALWPGMDAAAFAGRCRPRIYRQAGWKCALFAGLRFAAGGWLVFRLAERLANPVAVGWCGMVGMVLMLHFGVFDWLALFWRRMGFDVERIMDAPWRARSLADFWGSRWNRAFSHVANRALFRPMTRRFGLAPGTLAGFALSGVAHELVISVPANAGYGLPTMYFLLQGTGVLLERWLGWRGDWRGRLLMVVTLTGPAFWLFHPAFMSGVVEPMTGRFAINF